ncbi:MAG: hypothetical protein OXG67_05160 [bacterium]|nr:hypothetical protein [bacterium]MCY3889145.1 hypothetical protein [bacterium]
MKHAPVQLRPLPFAGIRGAGLGVELWPNGAAVFDVAVRASPQWLNLALFHFQFPYAIAGPQKIHHEDDDDENQEKARQRYH